MYTLKLGNFYLAPKHSIKIEESSDFESLIQRDEALCGCGTVLTTKKEYTFRITITGGGSLESAWSLERLIEAQLNLASCSQILLRRRVFDETELVYKVTKASIRMIEPKTQYLCERILTLELKLTLSSNYVSEILTIYEQAVFPRIPSVIINPWEPVDAPIVEQPEFPEPTNVFV